MLAIGVAQSGLILTSNRVQLGKGKAMQRKNKTGWFLTIVGILITAVALLTSCSENQLSDQTVGEGVGDDAMVADEVVELVDSGRAANTQFTSVNTLTTTVNIEDQITTLTIHSEVAASSGSDGSFKVDLNTIVDASDLKSDLTPLLNKRWEYDECGQRFSTRGATVRPAGNGQLHIGVTARGELWECIKTKVPVTHREMKKIGFIKTKVPVIRWEMKTLKTRLLSQSAHIEALVRPEIDGDAVTAEVKVTKAMPSGLLGRLVKAVGLHDEIKDLIQSKIDEKLRGQKILLPKEVRAYKVVIHSADFIALDGDGLGLKISASGSITQAQLSTLLNKRVGEAK